MVGSITSRSKVRSGSTNESTGFWLRDLARQLPSKDLALFGVDIGSALFPAPGAAASGPQAQLRSHDIRTPFPESWGWKDNFDVVHQRLLIWGIKASEWPVVISNLVDVLKPGGYIQLVEAEWIDPANPASEETRPELAKQAALQRWSTESFGMDIDIAYKLEKLLSDAGLEDVGVVQFDHGYGALAKAESQKNVSAELWVECFRTLDDKIPSESHQTTTMCIDGSGR
jgi:SAM-dependent methyltransferase